MPQPIMMSVVRFLHNLFSALWIGGILTLAIVILPGIRKNPKVSAPMVVADIIQDRLSIVAFISMAGLAITGILLGRSSKNFTGLFGFGTPYMTALSIKHILMILMVVLAFVRRWLNKRIKTEPTAALQKASGGVLILNSLFGVVVLFLSAML